MKRLRWTAAALLASALFSLNSCSSGTGNIPTPSIGSISPDSITAGSADFTLFVSGTRDLLLGDTSTLHRAMLHAGVDTRLVVFEALPHAFWYHFEFPETREALQLTADFLAEKVAR